MDCYFFIVVTIIIFFLMLFFPQTAICGASLGLMLWFQTVLPVLLPFLILTALLLKSNGFFLISRLVRPILRPLFGISDYGSFALLVGFLCGYPMGSKVTADLKREGKRSLLSAFFLQPDKSNVSDQLHFLHSFKASGSSVPRYAPDRGRSYPYEYSVPQNILPRCHIQRFFSFTSFYLEYAG